MKNKITKIISIAILLNILIFIINILNQGFTDIVLKTIKSIGTTFIFSIIYTCILTLHEKKEYKIFSTTSLILCSIGYFLTTLIAWELIDFCIVLCDSSESISRNFLLSLIILSLSSAHISLILNIKNKNNTIKYLKRTVIFLSTVLDIFILLSLFNIITLHFIYIPALTILVLLIIITTIITLLLGKTSKDNLEKNYYSNKTNDISKQNKIMYKEDYENLQK